MIEKVRLSPFFFDIATHQSLIGKGMVPFVKGSFIKKGYRPD